jgi:putative NADH-flavin reductase
MRLLIAGASGRTGQLLTRLALENGHAVTALMRNPARLGLSGDRLRVLSGDVLAPATLADATRGQDAIVSLLAPRPRVSGRVYVEGTRNLTDAAVREGARRFVVVSAQGAGVEAHALPLAYREVLRIPVVARLYPDIQKMEEELTTHDDLEWTVVRPPILTNGPYTGRYRTATGPVVPSGLRLSRADLAAFLLGVVENNLYVREIVAVAR